MKKIIFAAGLSAGLLFMGMALFAVQIGLDNDAGWGRGRLFLLNIGILLVLFSLAGWAFKDKITSLGKRLSVFSNVFDTLSYSKRLTIFSIPASMIVISTYIWFALPAFETSSFNYYSLLASAFKKHQLYLVEEPSMALLALEDPYDYQLRKESEVEDFLWDTSLYNKKFYLYWGPVPSLILMVFNEEKLDLIGDQHLVLVFMVGLYLYCALLGHFIWARFNQTLPAWLFGICLVVIGLSAPATWMLDYSRVYEAAIAGSQFFFIGGCYWAISSLLDVKSPNLTRGLLLAGLHWALALGTRITILPLILFTTGMTLFFVFKRTGPISIKSHLPVLACLVTPLVIAALGLGWYNWARFNSIFEFGLKYQLATVNYNTFHKIFSTEYISGNLHNYFLHPMLFQKHFPFIRAIENTFSNERLAGLAYLSPYILYAGLAPLWFMKFRDLLKEQMEERLNSSWLLIFLAGASIIPMITMLSYYFPATRFGEDFMPSLLLLSTLGLGQGYRLLKNNKIAQGIYIILAVTIASFSIITSSLVAFPLQKARGVIIFIEGIYQFLGYQ